MAKFIKPYKKLTMGFPSYLSFSLRYLSKHKGYALINIAGLSIGVASCILILQHVFYERSYDKFNVNADNIYRIKQENYKQNLLTAEWAAGCGAIGPALKESLPEVESYAQLYRLYVVMNVKEKEVIAPNKEEVFFATNSFLSMFSFPAIMGDKHTALDKPYSMVLTKTAAKKYFRDEDPIGKSINVNNKYEFKVTAVLDDVPSNSHFKFDILLSYPTWTEWVKREFIETWWNTGMYTYITLRPGADPNQVEKKVPSVVNAKVGEELRKDNLGFHFQLQPLKSVHLNSNVRLEAEPNGDAQTVSALTIIAVLILIIALGNYINLATARSLTRGKEVGLRKTFGSDRFQLIYTYLVETAIINTLGILCGVVIVFLSYFYFGDSIEGLNYKSWLHSDLYLILLGIFIAGTILSGYYPALVFAKLGPMQAFKNKLGVLKSGVNIRKLLVLVQFLVSLVLITVTVIILAQIRYMRGQRLGVDLEQTLVVEAPLIKKDPKSFEQRLNSFKASLRQNSTIKSITASSNIPGDKSNWNDEGVRLLKGGTEKGNMYRITGVDTAFINAFNLELAYGANFRNDQSKAVIVNEAAVSLLDIPSAQLAINRQVNMMGDTFSIIGVVKNYHHESLKVDYDPMIFYLFPPSYAYICIKLNAANLTNVMPIISKSYQEYFSGNPFNYFFLDEHFNKQYQSEERLAKALTFFTVIIVFLSCLGLFGLSSYLVIQRTKEIGVRKVLGASLERTILLLVKDFIMPVILASFIGVPISYFLMRNWLSDFPFRIPVSWYLLTIPVLMLLIIAMISVGFHTYKVATINPAKTLRHE